MMDAIRGSSGLNVLLVLGGKFGEKKTRGRSERSWTDDVMEWTKKKHDEVTRLSEDR